MKIAIVGAGAVGGYLGARQALAGGDVVCIDRGAHLATIRANGLPLIEADGSERPRVEAPARIPTHGGLGAPVTTDIRSEIWRQSQLQSD